jgi:hypothetical protein
MTRVGRELTDHSQINPSEGQTYASERHRYRSGAKSFAIHTLQPPVAQQEELQKL